MSSLQLTYTAVLLAVFANQICLPIPSIVFLIAAGALSAHGNMQASIIVLLGVLGCLAGDGIWFWFGRRWGSKAMRLMCRFSGDPRHCSRNAHEKFRRYGVPLLCVNKFIPGLDGLMPPLSGAEGVSLTRFLALDTVGSILWSAFYVGLGRLFSNELDFAIVWAKHFGMVLGITVAVPLGLYAAWRQLVLVRMIRQLRLRRISPRMLDRKLKSKKKVAVLDLLDFEAETESPEAIPGALRVDPSRLRKSPHIAVSGDAEIVLYSSSGGDTLSARVAVTLKRIGVDKVWVLEGGLKAWREQGFPLTRSLETREVFRERFGVKLPVPSIVNI